MAEARADVDEARGAAFNVMDKLYANPRRALDGMQAYSKKYGDEALVKKLEQDPAYFGTTRGYPGSGTAASLQGFKDRALSKELAVKIPTLVKAAITVENKLLDMQRGYAETGPSGPNRGKDGMDF
ncbi:hypothetical protein ASD74_23865 [Rhizobium sp. Root564]|nr:hypothetical protein ASD74_23865 [Rhizobium sp. Root564]